MAKHHCSSNVSFLTYNKPFRTDLGVRCNNATIAPVRIVTNDSFAAPRDGFDIATETCMYIRVDPMLLTCS